jgi:hypothetical protein
MRFHSSSPYRDDQNNRSLSVSSIPELMSLILGRGAIRRIELMFITHAFRASEMTRVV